MYYIPRFEKIKAFQLTCEMVAAPSLVPEWAAQYVSQPCSQGVAGVLLTRPVMTDYLPVCALYTREWLLQGQDGDLRLMSDETFKNRYVECQDI